MICNKLKQIRLNNNYTLTQMADIMNVTRNTVRNYEDGKTAPDIFYIKNICNKFNVSLEDLVYDKGEKPFETNTIDSDSYEFEGTFIQVMDNCENEQEASLIYDIFLSLVYSVLSMQTSYRMDPDFVENFIKVFKAKDVDFDCVYRALYPYLNQFSKQARISSLIPKIDELCSYYSNGFKTIFDNALDDSYGVHELD